MKKPHPILYLLLCLCLAAPLVYAAPKLESAKIKTLYREGEFEKIREILERFLKQSEQGASRDERVMAYKYLGVVYASKPGGTPQAEAYFFRLFDLAPQVSLTELYVSTSVNEVFKNTRERFLSERRSAETVDEYGNPITAKNNEADAMALAANKRPATDTARESKPKAPIKNTPDTRPSLEKKGPAIWPWFLGAALVGGGIGLYLLTSQDAAPEIDTIHAGP